MSWTEDWNKHFVATLRRADPTRHVCDAFADAVHAMALEMVRATVIGEYARKCEDEFAEIAARHGGGYEKTVGELLGIAVCALEERREDFLGEVLEGIGAANTRNGQFFTPRDVAKLCAEINVSDMKPEPGVVTRIADEACGASVMLIAQAEAMLKAGWRQRDILIHAADIDVRSADISYVQLTLLGYAAKVDCQNTLSLQKYRPTWYTIGYFTSCMPMRLREAS